MEICNICHGYELLDIGTDSPVVVVLSGSMEPGFVRGDLLFLKKNNTINAGDIIVFKVIIHSLYITSMYHLNICLNVYLIVPVY